MLRPIGVILILAILLLAGACGPPAGYAPSPPDTGNGDHTGY